MEVEYPNTLSVTQSWTYVCLKTRGDWTTPAVPHLFKETDCIAPASTNLLTGTGQHLLSHTCSGRLASTCCYTPAHREQTNTCCHTPAQRRLASTYCHIPVQGDWAVPVTYLLIGYQPAPDVSYLFRETAAPAITHLPAHRGLASTCCHTPVKHLSQHVLTLPAGSFWEHFSNQLFAQNS